MPGNKTSLPVSRAHAAEEVGVRSQLGLHGVDHTLAGVTSDLTERVVLAQVVKLYPSSGPAMLAARRLGELTQDQE